VKVVLMRHGIAVDPMDPECPPDAERPLTPKGLRRTRAAAAGLRAMGIAPAAVLTSPLRRALETAEIAAEALGCETIRTQAALSGGTRTRDVFDLWAALEADCVLTVGHAPQLDLLLASCLGAGAPALAPLKKAAAACVELDIVAPSGGQLAWLLAPRALRKLGREAAGSQPPG
jgi:phosphohistidine phosphatase